MPEVTVINQNGFLKKAKQRVCAYCRVSRSTADQLNSYARQISVYTKLINNNPEWEMVEVFADEGITGTSAEKRPEFLRMIKLCEEGRIDRIITKSVSRFGRNVAETVEYCRKLKKYGVGVQFEKEGVFSLSIADEMLLTTFAAIAQEESVEISIRLRNANSKRMANGDFIDGNAPYGFRLENRKLVEYEDEANVVRRIFSDYLNGLSTHEIARNLNAEQIPSRENKLWQACAIRFILKNEKYKGDFLCQRTYHTTVLPFKQKRNHGDEDQYYFSNSHIGIVDAGIFDKANEILNARREKLKSESQCEQYLFTGKIKCKECGRTYYRRKKNGGVYWVCFSHLIDREQCPTHYIREERIQDAFITMVNKLRYANGDILKKTIGKIEQVISAGKKNNEEAYGMSRQISDLNSKLLMLEQLHTQGYLATDVYLQQSIELQKKVADLKGARLQTMSTGLSDKLQQLNELATAIDTITEPLENFNEDIFSDIVEAMVIDKNDNVKFTVKGGLEFTEPL